MIASGRISYFARRLLGSIVLLVIVMSVVFTANRQIGDPALMVLGVNATEEDVADVRERGRHDAGQRRGAVRGQQDDHARDATRRRAGARDGSTCRAHGAAHGAQGDERGCPPQCSRHWSFCYLLMSMGCLLIDARVALVWSSGAA